MLHPIRNIIQGYKNKQRITHSIANRKDIINTWIKNGKPTPTPHEVKQVAIEEYKNLYQCKCLVETGTYLGDMMEIQKNNFEQLYSIELSEMLYSRAIKRFKHDKNIHLFQGDSGKVLFTLAEKLNDSTLFWLDGHYSAGFTAKGDKECPVIEELTAILASPNCNKFTILIDDARCFNGEHDYPTIDEIKNLFNSNNKTCNLEIRDDIIRITHIAK